MKKPSPLPPEVAAQFAEWARRGNIPHHQVCAWCGCSYVAKKRWSMYCRHTCAIYGGRARRKAEALAMNTHGPTAQKETS